MTLLPQDEVDVKLYERANLSTFLQLIEIFIFSRKKCLENVQLR